MLTSRIRPRERDAIIQALRAGVVPKVGLRHIQVGRTGEIEELIRDIERIEDGGATITLRYRRIRLWQDILP